MLSPAILWSQEYSLFGQVENENTDSLIGHPVYYLIPGYEIQDTVFTDSTGYYSLNITIDSVLEGSTILIDTKDNCIEEPHMRHVLDTIEELNFQICNYNDTLECEANFVFIAIEPYVFQFTNLSIGNIESYFWDFGDGEYSNQKDPSHKFPGDSIYNVSLLVISYDSSMSQLVQEVEPKVISGTVYAGMQALSLGRVNLMQPNMPGYSLSSQLDSNGHFEIMYLYDGIYDLYVQPQITNMPHVFPLYFPTYLEDAFEWSNSYSINTLEKNHNSIFIQLLSRPDIFYGNGTIVGEIDFKINSIYQQDYFCLILVDKDGSPLKYVYADEFLGFELNDIPFGEYKLVVDAYGLLSEPIEIVLTEEKPLINVYFSMKDSVISSTSTPVEMTNVEVYPNPTTDIINVANLPYSSRIVRIFDVYGKECYILEMDNAESQESISISYLNAGVYFIVVEYDKGRQVQSFVKM